MGSVQSSAGFHSQILPDEFTRRIVVLGKTGAGKSSLANTLFGEKVCETNHSPTSGTAKCQAESRIVNGRSVTVIDTPGFFDTGRSEEEMKVEIVRCITECAPGPHVFIIVLKVEKYTEQENEVINRMADYFSDDALRFATVLFTHGDQLPEGEKIEAFVRKSKDLSHVVRKCGNRCNVIDNKYWNNNRDEYRSNQFQVEELLITMDTIIKANNEGYYTHEMLQKVKRSIEEEEDRLKEDDEMPSLCEIREKSKAVARATLLHDVSGLNTRALLKIFLSGSMKLVTTEDRVIPGHGATSRTVAVPTGEGATDGPTSSDAEAASKDEKAVEHLK
ncbi:GTPase IMAP family member 4-like [Nothobranchius furzeri]|uniref:GTPase IMAP family member 4-like n=3 Tax=Nothobranchius furzeri TaxID=105023 RepID=A0A9D2Y607_NOTFU|nr:GTPase IMAP family member 4-like [Nothobranchius furzeri]